MFGGMAKEEESEFHVILMVPVTWELLDHVLKVFHVMVLPFLRYHLRYHYSTLFILLCPIL